ncbi:hypothetical protein, partial [Bartonella sp. TT110JLCBS]|uniref:hypothetical protein n=1 Tax=Bartonella sp. TT110JLCBS TaxID=3243578 RepID=UPI0035CF2A35
MQASALTHYVQNQAQPMIHFNETGHYFYGSVMSKWPVIIALAYIYILYNIIKAIRGKPSFS